MGSWGLGNPSARPLVCCCILARQEVDGETEDTSEFTMFIWFKVFSFIELKISTHLYNALQRGKTKDLVSESPVYLAVVFLEELLVLFRIKFSRYKAEGSRETTSA